SMPEPCPSPAISPLLSHLTPTVLCALSLHVALPICPPRAIYMGEGAVPVKEILIPFATGLAVFLFGMQLIRIGLGSLAGDRLESLLLRFTRTPARGMFTGLIVTSLLQSSSAVTDRK